MAQLPEEIIPPLNNQAPSEQKLAQWEDQLWADGYLVIKNALGAEATAHFRKRLETMVPSPGYKVSLVRLFERGMDFIALLENEPVLSLMRRVLGPEMHVVMLQGHRNFKGGTFSNWHADELHVQRLANVSDEVDYPPVINTVNCHYYVVDVDESLGPTQVVPASHRACRDPRPEDGDVPGWRGRGPVSLTCQAGDCVLQSGQIWHRGAPNATGRFRLSVVPAYGRRFVAQRFWPYLNYHLSRDILDRCTPSQRKLLGEHEIGAYG